MKRLLFVCLVFAIGAALIGQEKNSFWDMEHKIRQERAHHQKTLNFKANPLTQNYDLKYHRLVWEVDPAVLYISGALTSYFIPKGDKFNQLNFSINSIAPQFYCLLL